MDGTVPEARCGHTTEYDDQDPVGNVTCWRKTWDKFDSCIWHADETSKPVRELGASRSEHPERLDGAILKDTELRDHISFSNCSLREADLSGADLVFSDLTGADLQETDLSEVDFWAADLSNANLQEATGNKPRFEIADLDSAELQNADLPDIELQDASCVDATIHNADFSDGLLRGVDLSETNLQDAKLENADLEYADFTDSYARNVNLSKACLENAILTRADLRGARIDDADLYQAQFADVRINSLTSFSDICRYESENRSPVINERILDEEQCIKPLKAATWVYRRLESLHAENALAERSRSFHIRKQEARRKFDLRQRNIGRYLVGTVNNNLTRHGESLQRLLISTSVLIVAFGIVYPFVGGVADGGIVYQISLQTEPMEGIVQPIIRGLYFSAITFTTIGYANVAPHGLGSRLLVAVESLIGAILIALFVYVLGRRVAR